MAPKTEVAIEQELEDLNVEPLRIRLSSQMDGCGDDDGPASIINPPFSSHLYNRVQSELMSGNSLALFHLAFSHSSKHI